MKRPSWTRDETILALDLSRRRALPPGKTGCAAAKPPSMLTQKFITYGVCSARYGERALPFSREGMVRDTEPRVAQLVSLRL